MSQIIEILIACDGSTQIQTKGFAGSACLQATQFLEEALGVKLADQRTAEFYRPAEQIQALNQHASPGNGG